MTYSSAGLIQASDYNTFTTTAGGLNDIWATGSGDKGWGQTAFTAAATGGTVTATQWAALVNNLATAGTQTGTTLTSRTAPTAGTTIGILSALSTDITNCTTNRGNAAAAGTISSTWTGAAAKTTATANGTQGAWTITWTQTVTFPSADQARYFWNAGGRVQLNMSFTANSVDNDPEWNRLSGYPGQLTLVGRVNGAAQTIAATSYTGFTRGGTGGTQTTLASTTGWYNLTSTPTSMLQINDATAPYTGDYIKVTAAATSSTVLTLVTTWVSSSRTGAGETTNISGGTDTASPFSAFGTAPAVLCRFIPPSTSYLTNTWGTPAVASSVA